MNFKHTPHFKKRSVNTQHGVLDVDFSANTDNFTYKAYRLWENMLYRCYHTTDVKCMKSYKDCSVCEEWLLFSNFLEWYKSNYIEGYTLDKDIIVKNNRIYSPETCCFVPKELNSLFGNKGKKNGKLPIGVRKIGNNIYAQLWKYGNVYTFGTFDNTKDAHSKYVLEKEKYIKEVAQKYFNEGKITERVYDALMKYEVEITD